MCGLPVNYRQSRPFSPTSPLTVGILALETYFLVGNVLWGLPTCRQAMGVTLTETAVLTIAKATRGKIKLVKFMVDGGAGLIRCDTCLLGLLWPTSRLPEILKF